MNTNNGNGTNPNNGDHQDGRARFRFRPNEHNAPNGVPFSPTPGSHSRTTPRTPLFAGAPRPPPGQNQPQPQQAPPRQQFPHAHASSTYVHQASSPHQHPSQEGGGGQYGYGQEMFSPGRTFGGSMPHVQAPASHHCGGGGVQPGHRMFSPDAHAPTYASHGGGWHQDGMPPSVIYSHSNVEDRTLASGVSNLSLKTTEELPTPKSADEIMAAANPSASAKTVVENPDEFNTELKLAKERNSNQQVKSRESNRLVNDARDLKEAMESLLNDEAAKHKAIIKGLDEDWNRIDRKSQDIETDYNKSIHDLEIEFTQRRTHLETSRRDEKDALAKEKKETKHAIDVAKENMQACLTKPNAFLETAKVGFSLIKDASETGEMNANKLKTVTTYQEVYKRGNVNEMRKIILKNEEEGTGGEDRGDEEMAEE